MLFFHHPTNLPDMNIDTLVLIYQLPKIDDRQVDVDIAESELNTDFEECAPQQEGVIHEVFERPGKEYLQESPTLHTWVNGKILRQRY